MDNLENNNSSYFPSLGEISMKRANKYRVYKKAVDRSSGGKFHLEGGNFIWEENFLPENYEEVQIEGSEYYLVSVPTEALEDAVKILQGRKDNGIKYYVSQPFNLEVFLKVFFTEKREDVYRAKYELKVNVIAVSKPSVKFKGKKWSLIGIKDFVSCSSYLYTEEPEEVRRLMELMDKTNRYFVCEHCNSMRQRNSAAFVKSEDGETAILGSSCVEEYVGVGLLKKLNNLNDFLKDLGGSFEKYQRCIYTYNAVELTAWVLWAMAEYGYKYISKKVDGIQNTVSEIQYRAGYFDEMGRYSENKFVPFSKTNPELEGEVPEKYKKVALDIYKELHREIREGEKTFNDFEKKLRTFFEYDKENERVYITERNFVFIGCVAKSFMEGNILPEYECDFRKETVIGEFVGKIGDKITVRGTVQSCSEFERIGFNGGMETRWRYEVVDENKNNYFFEMNKKYGCGEMEFQGKIKYHSEWNKKKTNKLNYVKVLKYKAKEQAKEQVKEYSYAVEKAMDEFYKEVEG